MLMAALILVILHLHKKKTFIHSQRLRQIESHYEKNILKTQLEIQEQTFQHISREIHDNISLSLTLAKLNLHTLDLEHSTIIKEKINNTVELITKSINELSDISKGLNSNIIIQQGLTKAVEDEIHRIRQIGLFSIEYNLDGEPVYMTTQRELIVFRIVQEAFNNILKHAKASHATLAFYYKPTELMITIKDDGKGFDTTEIHFKKHAGLKNMETRIKMLRGSMRVQSTNCIGTELFFVIPIE